MNPPKGDVESNTKRPDTNKFEEHKRQVDEVKGIMIDNLNKIADRGDKLEDLGKRAEELQEKSSLFDKATKKLEKKYWWREHKMKLIIGAMILTIMLVIGIVFSFL